MRANPEPQTACWNFYSKRAVFDPNPSRTKTADLFETKAGMIGVVLEEFEFLLRQMTHRDGEFFVAGPKRRGREMVHSSLQFPELKSWMAFSAK